MSTSFYGRPIFLLHNTAPGSGPQKKNKKRVSFSNSNYYYVEKLRYRFSSVNENYIRTFYKYNHEDEQMGHCIPTFKIGQPVDNFELNTYLPADFDFGRVSLNELKKDGKWTILVFYPADFTFVCSTELKDFGDLYDEFKKLGAELITVSTDTEYTHLAWRREEESLKNANYPMAADPTGGVAKRFGVYDKASGLALRGTFIINPEGVMVASEVNYYNFGRSAAETLRKLRAAVYVANHPAEACPANWDEGAKTLTPGPKLVGKVAQNL